MMTAAVHESCKSIIYKLARNEMPEIHAYDGNPSIDMCHKIVFSHIGRVKIFQKCRGM